MPEQAYTDLINIIRSYHPSDDFSMIEKAYNIANSAHKKQLRKSGEPYIMHPLAVAKILAEYELDKESIVAGILHDVVEDTLYTIEDIKEEFNDEIALLVDGVTKLTAITYTKDKEEIQAENYRKMFLAMAKDIRVILIKLADRLHNMRTLMYMPEDKQKEKARETLDIYAPLANRLGISKIKVELEDLSFRYLNKEAYSQLVENISERRIDRVRRVEGIVKDIKEALEKMSIDAKVEGRPKNLFSIYKKMISQDKDLDEIYDLYAVRAIVKSVKDCYGILGIVHELYKPVPGRFKDYIAMPKPNMYQSLHTTLIGPSGFPFEIQIRTEDMHKTAEYGIAAHWRYKVGDNLSAQTVKDISAERKLNWLKQILEWQQDMSDNKEFMNALKTDLDVYSEDVYAFTPAGDIITMPSGSIPIDFAYYIHSGVGNRMVGARVNSRIVTFDYIIKTGDQIDIITSKNSSGPSRDWLKIVKSSQARSKINQWFRKQFKNENVIKGKDLLDKYMKQKGYEPHELLKKDWMNKVQEKYGFKDWDALCAAVGHGGLKEGQIINKIYQIYETTKKKEMKPEDIIKEVIEEPINRKGKKSKSGITVKGAADVAVRFSKCCGPVPGDEIVGFVTRGRGVSIHRTDCINMIHLNEVERHRIIEADWEESVLDKEGQTYRADLQVTGSDRSGLLLDLSKILTEENIKVVSLNARAIDTEHSIFNITVEISNLSQLNKLSNKFKSVPEVDQVIRTNS